MRKFALLLAALGFALFELLSPPPVSACLICHVRLRCVNDDCWTDYVCNTPHFPQNSQVSCDPTPTGCVMSGEFCGWA